MNRSAEPCVSGVGAGSGCRSPREERALRREEVGINGSWWRWAQPLGGVLVLLAVLSRLGTAPVAHAVGATEPGTLALGAGIAMVTTTCAAWRWQVVAGRLRVGVRMPAAVAACYRAQFINVTLPGGVLGDVDRGVRHGRSVDDLGRGVRAVVWERAAGQAVLLTLTATALVASPLLGWAPPLDLGDRAAPAAVGVGMAALLLVAVVSVRGARGRAHAVCTPRRVEFGRRAADDLRALAGPATLAPVALASVVVVAGHVQTFVLSARAVGVRAPLRHLVPVALVVLVVGALPVNVGGWGPREGAAAWGFAAAGLGAGEGLAASVAYGTVVLVATAPGALLLLVGWWRAWGRARPPRPQRGPRAEDARPVVVSSG